MVISNTTFEMYNSFFKTEFFLFLTSLARFFVKRKVNLSVSYFKYSHLTCSSLKLSLCNSLIVNKICSFIFSTYSLFNDNNLLNFHKHFCEKIHSSDWMKKESANNLWQKKLKYQDFFTRSCRTFYMEE